MGKCCSYIVLLMSVLFFVACRTARPVSKEETHNGVTKLRSRHMKRLVEFAALQLNAPYKWGGSSPKGFDCSGFTWYCFNHSGLTLPRTALEQSTSGKKVRGRKAKTGDLIFFKGPDHQQKKVAHVGIVVSGRKQNIKFIHAGSKGITISMLREDYFRKRFKGIRRVRR
ncbi:C40 family peptidase [Rurimicrobium arvi]|uniref:NlpC/P60 domain-containing protein n=1 Tax=Rurimicrobium arvi TaxID=2049916 RepID=A0ABP8N240_9BACT